MADFWTVFIAVIVTFYMYDRYKAALRQIRMEEMIKQKIKEKERLTRVDELYGRDDEAR